MDSNGNETSDGNLTLGDTATYGDALCSPDLRGVFCLLCVQPDGVYYVHGSFTAVAHCEPCKGTVATTVTVIVAVALALMLAHWLAVRYASRRVGTAVNIARKLGLRNKLKILVGFYLVLARVPTVYEVPVPHEIGALLHTLSSVCSLGVELSVLTPTLQCLGITTYLEQLGFYLTVPAVLMLSATGGAYVCLRLSSVTVSRDSILQEALPAVLGIGFLFYPLVSNVAFAAFSCYPFDEGRVGWLKADVSVACHDDAQYTTVKLWAWFAVLLYPVGNLVLVAYLLRRFVRPALGAPTPLSRAIGFLYVEYRPEFYGWELMEMFRRLFLVGIMVVFESGSMRQLVLGCLFNTIYLIIQMQAAPYASRFDGILATAASASLLCFFLLCLSFKLSAFAPVQDRLSPELRADFEPHVVQNTWLTLAIVSATVVVLVVLTGLQVTHERKRLIILARTARARRLKWTSDDSDVLLEPPSPTPPTQPHFTPTIKPGAVSERFHLFLSHVWGTGQVRHPSSRSAQPWSAYSADSTLCAVWCAP